MTNALLTYGFEIRPGLRWRESNDLASAIALAFVDCLAAGLLWCIRILLLAPFRLEYLDLFLFSLIAAPLLSTLGGAAKASGRSMLSRIGGSAVDLVFSTLAFGIALVASRGDYSFPEALIAGLASGLGYWLASNLLGALKERLDLSGLPSSMKGAPSMLVSAGLMSMAFLGIDAILVQNLVGNP